MMRVVALKHQTHILAGSPYGDQKAVQTYDDEDIITTKGEIW